MNLACVFLFSSLQSLACTLSLLLSGNASVSNYYEPGLDGRQEEAPCAIQDQRYTSPPFFFFLVKGRGASVLSISPAGSHQSNNFSTEPKLELLLSSHLPYLYSLLPQPSSLGGLYPRPSGCLEIRTEGEAQQIRIAPPHQPVRLSRLVEPRRGGSRPSSIHALSLPPLPATHCISSFHSSVTRTHLHVKVCSSKLTPPLILPHQLILRPSNLSRL